MKRIVFAAAMKACWNQVKNELREASFEIDMCTDADQVVEKVLKTPCVGLFIDQHLPYGQTFSKQETNYGTVTGEVVARYLLERQPALPIVLLATPGYTPNASEKVTVLNILDLLPSKALELARKF